MSLFVNMFSTTQRAQLRTQLRIQQSAEIEGLIQSPANPNVSITEIGQQKNSPTFEIIAFKPSKENSFRKYKSNLFIVGIKK